MDILPSMPKIKTTTINNKNTNAPLLKEYAWDFDKDDFLLENGKFVIVEGLEALKIRNYLSLKIYKGRFFIYKNKVGTRLKDLIGRDRNYVSLHVKSMIEEAILDNVYVTGIEDVEISYNNGKIIVEFTVLNIYQNYTTEIEI
ncbi:DUF2634 domain-containing protein [Clostridium butyricum]|uniref:DUF2634 domain-containing protein n=1 Tax=Clostridium butyricum TaxID=1492 RepID=UPI00204B7F05|nr:DUF2634 domain-containing protein [Clostridium butyricum]DAQ72122.1 MAG TPA: Protein of unknown function (DUF2634) [Caudoviricetes sp.]